MTTPSFEKNNALPKLSNIKKCSVRTKRKLGVKRTTSILFFTFNNLRIAGWNCSQPVKNLNLSKTKDEFNFYKVLQQLQYSTANTKRQNSLRVTSSDTFSVDIASQMIGPSSRPSDLWRHSDLWPSNSWLSWTSVKVTCSTICTLSEHVVVHCVVSVIVSVAVDCCTCWAWVSCSIWWFPQKH